MRFRSLRARLIATTGALIVSVTLATLAYVSLLANRTVDGRLAEDLEKELQKKEQQATQRILQELTGIIEKMGKERGFLLIVERRSGGVIYGDPEGDVTDEVIKLYDQEKAKK